MSKYETFVPTGPGCIRLRWQYEIRPAGEFGCWEHYDRYPGVRPEYTLIRMAKADWCLWLPGWLDEAGVLAVVNAVLATKCVNGPDAYLPIVRCGELPA